MHGGDSLVGTWCSGAISPFFHSFLNLERRFWNQIFTYGGDDTLLPLYSVLVFFLFYFFVFFLAVTHLCLREAHGGSQLGALGQRQVLRFLEAPLERGQLEAGINGSRFSDLLWFSIHHPDFWLALFFVCGRTLECIL